MNVVLWQMGAANVGTSPVGTAGTPQTVYFNFSQATTAGNLVFSEPGTGSDFVASTTNPIVDPNATMPQAACTPGKMYAAYTSCPYFVSLNARLPGAVSGELQMLDANNKVVPLTNTYVSGIGLGPDIALLTPTGQTIIGSGLVAPQQVAADALGNSYVADSSQGKVFELRLVRRRLRWERRSAAA